MLDFASTDCVHIVLRCAVHGQKMRQQCPTRSLWKILPLPWLRSHKLLPPVHSSCSEHAGCVCLSTEAEVSVEFFKETWWSIKASPSTYTLQIQSVLQPNPEPHITGGMNILLALMPWGTPSSGGNLLPPVLVQCWSTAWLHHLEVETWCCWPVSEPGTSIVLVLGGEGGHSWAGRGAEQGVGLVAIFTTRSYPLCQAI